MALLEIRGFLWINIENIKVELRADYLAVSHCLFLFFRGPAGPITSQSLFLCKQCAFALKMPALRFSHKVIVGLASQTKRRNSCVFYCYTDLFWKSSECRLDETVLRLASASLL